MWTAMLFLYPELFNLFQDKMPTYERLEAFGYPKDATSNFFMEWMDSMEDDEFEVYEKHPREPYQIQAERDGWVDSFIESISDPRTKHICMQLVKAEQHNNA